MRRLTEQSVLFAACVKSPPRAEVALRAHADVLNVVFQVDGHLFALKDELAVHLAAVADGLAAAGADGFHLFDGMSQFFTAEQAEQLFMVTVDLNIPVICYGLRADFSLRGFPGSTRLLELAHTIEEMKTICTCGRKATCNCRKVNGRFVFEGEQVAIDLENDVQYVSMCPQCYFRERSAFYAARR